MKMLNSFLSELQPGNRLSQCHSFQRLGERLSWKAEQAGRLWVFQTAHSSQAGSESREAWLRAAEGRNRTCV